MEPSRLEMTLADALRYLLTRLAPFTRPCAPNCGTLPSGLSAMTVSSVDWSEDAFFDMPDRDSLDGGTTSAGALWHGISPRWGHSLHTMCSYHGMFPARGCALLHPAVLAARRLGTRPVQRARHRAAPSSSRG